MPIPKEGESKEEFISRFMSSEKAQKDYPDKDKRYAIAESIWKSKGKEKEIKRTCAYVKIKEEELTEEEEKITYFYGATTLPDRVRDRLKDGRIIEGEILDKNVLDRMASYINDESRMGGKVGSFRTIGLFHDRVKAGDLGLDEAGYVIPGTAKVEPLKEFPGHYGLKVGTKTNKYYQGSPLYPKYTPEIIQYKIENGGIGLSMEYDNSPDQERIVETDKGLYRYVMDTDDFRGFSYARANLIGNPTSVSIKEIRDILDKKHNGGTNTMAEQPTETEVKLKESEAKVQELTAKIKELESKDADDPKLKEMNDELVKVKEQITSQKLELDQAAAKIKESIETAFSGLKFESKPLHTENTDPKLKEINDALDKGVKTKEWTDFVQVCDTRIKEQNEHFTKVLRTTGIDMSETSLKVKCVGRNFVVEAPKTKDVITSGDMDESTYYQTNAMFADKYVPGIVETFQKSDNLLSAMVKEQHTGGNDKYPWRIWTDFATFTGDNTAAVDPDVTSVSTTQYDFLKLETPIREYRKAVEVSDFTQYHSQAAVGDLLMKEANRAAEVVVNSLNADLYKGKCDGTSGWVGVNGLLAVADYSTHSTLYGRTRSSYGRLYNANSYDSTAEAISAGLIREGYAYVNSAGTNIADMAIVMHPHQWIRFLNTQDNAISGTANAISTIEHPVTMGPAPAEFGFRRNLIPHFDGIPVILDEACVDASGNADTFCVIDMSSEGFVLVTSKPIGMRGLAKVGTTEKVYVSWYGTAVYKRPRNLYVHDDLTLLGA